MSHRLTILFGLLAIFVLPFASVALADRDWRVPAAPAAVFNYPGGAPCNTTLQACISGVAAGSIVNVAANTYVTNQLVITSAIVLQGAGPAATVLQPLGAQRVITIGANIAAGVTISNLRVFSGSLSGAGGLGAGIASGAGTPLTLLNVDVVSNTNSSNSGGGIYAADALTMTNVNLIGNSDPGGAGGGLRASGSAHISGGRIEHNSSFNPGGGMRVTGPLTLVNVLVISNSNTSSTQDGGGIRADGGLSMLGGLVQNNISARDGGGIYATDAVISASEIISNAGDNGGGIFATGALTVFNTRLDRNRAQAGHGGSIYASSPGFTITLGGTSALSRTSVSSSEAFTNGGGLYAAGNVLLVGEVHFDSNIAGTAGPGDGGAIYAAGNVLDNAGTSVLLQVAFTGNNALRNGGAVRALGNVTLLNSPSFQGNRAGLGQVADGGAVYADGNVFLSRGSSIDNTARNGGAVYALGNVVFNVHDTGPNFAALDGGCAYAKGSITYNSANAVRCAAAHDGGAAFSSLTVTLSANGVGLFSGNRAGNSGGMATGDLVIVHDALVVSNTAAVGGAVAATHTINVVNSTFTTNTAALAGGAIAVLSGTATVTGSLFASNRITQPNGIGGAVWVTGTLNVSASQMLSNSIPGFFGAGGGMGASDAIVLASALFQGNSAASGSAVFGRAGVVASQSTFAGNGGINDRTGGGIAAITATLTSITMSDNSVCCTGASGGAVSATVAFISDSLFLRNSAFISGGAVLASNALVTNSRFYNNGGASEGAGIWLRTGAIYGSEFVGNSTGCCSSHAGGAVFAQGTVIVQNSQFTGNDSDHGGAIALSSGGPEIHGSMFTGNFVSCCGGGGALWSAAGFTSIDGSQFISNSVACCGDGGAIQGIGLSLLVSDTTLISNSVSGGNGGAVSVKHIVGVENSRLAANHADHNGGAVEGSGLATDQTVIIGSTFDGNTAGTSDTSCSGRGGAVHIPAGSPSLLVQDSLFTTNSADWGGAIGCDGPCTVQTSGFAGNAAHCLDGVTFSNIGAGGAIAATAALQVQRASFLRNSAGSTGGGAIAMIPSVAAALRVENSLFAKNRAANSVFGAHGAAVVISNTTTTAQLLFNTIVSDTVNPIPAISVYSGTTSVIDNIMAGHAAGIEQFGGTVFEDFNLYFNNMVTTTGTVASGGSSLAGNPLFVSPATDNYHLQVASPAIDRATDVGIVVDFDGQSRPNGAGFDIGFDERYQYDLYLPLIRR